MGMQIHSKQEEDLSHFEDVPRQIEVANEEYEI